MQFCVSSTQDEVVRVVDRVHTFAEEHLDAEQAVHRARVVVNEIITNALRHGNKFDTDKRITVEVIANGSGFNLRVEDEGEGFDPMQIESPLNGENVLRDHGRGIHIIEELADEVAYECGGRRVCVTICE